MPQNAVPNSELTSTRNVDDSVRNSTHIALPLTNTPKALPSSRNPINARCNRNNSIHNADIYARYQHNIPCPRSNAMNSQFMLLGATGLAYGNEYITSVNNVHRSSTMFENRPKFPSQKGPCLMFERPRMSRQMTGMA